MCGACGVEEFLLIFLPVPVQLLLFVVVSGYLWFVCRDMVGVLIVERV